MSNENLRILVINPGSTTTRIAIFDGKNQLFSRTINHGDSDILGDIPSQAEPRKQCVLQTLREENIELSSIDAIVGRGGMLPPIRSGGYYINEAMLEDLVNGKSKPHASNLGALIAYDLAKPLSLPAFIYDAVSSDELAPVAKITGLPELSRQSFCHVLNSRATARMIAEKHGKKYEETNYIVAHIGGGISVSAHLRGQIVDIISDDAGPFSPERAGSIPLGNIIDICYSGKYTKIELMNKLKKNSGMKGHMGTNDAREIERMKNEGNQLAADVLEAQGYQIAKGIGEMVPPLCGEVDAVIITGGLAHSESIVAEIKKRVSYIAPIEVCPGEREMEALALGALRILNNEETAHTYIAN